ncbi:hypothetical protein K504DRAFT_466456 [Pleomassaria siparia CBS 279.74]|uniref:Uncharacterized protein n=1 Tax=Pleomassaria siparia CBS 279.74 TaxID=1314801 RepID=A0A6G1KBK2_9PLEO|nr:hypothetical protein K504DRAFT_466456 [Pleomassaria siparia CBS 279.74]
MLSITFAIVVVITMMHYLLNLLEQVQEPLIHSIEHILEKLGVACDPPESIESTESTESETPYVTVPGRASELRLMPTVPLIEMPMGGMNCAVM